MEETISLQELVGVIKKRISLIVVCMILGISFAGAITFFILTPLYSSQAQLLVRLPQNETTNVNDINGNLQMINTYKDLIISDAVMTEVQQRLKQEYSYDYSVKELGASISVTQSPNSQMFSIVAKCMDPIVAQNIANQTALVFQEKAKDVLNVDKITIISSAIANITPVSPNDKINMGIGLIIGLVIGVLLAFIIELFDKTIKDDRFVEDELGFTILGIVPNMTIKELNAKVINVPNGSNTGNLSMKNEPFVKKVEMDNEDQNDSTPSRRSRLRV